MQGFTDVLACQCNKRFADLVAGHHGQSLTCLRVDMLNSMWATEAWLPGSDSKGNNELQRCFDDCVDQECCKWISTFKHDISLLQEGYYG